ncbi:MAG: hypothetical protein ACT4R6_09390 [Gemmatimonadaceae bacterium]
MSVLDVNAYIGRYPFRHVPHPEPESLVRVMQREGIQQAWVGHLAAPWLRDPAAANEELAAALAPSAYNGVLLPVPALRPDWPAWRDKLKAAGDAGAPAVRAYPMHWGLAAGDPALAELAAACAVQDMALLLTVRFEDMRQRHQLDVAPDLPAALIRELARAGSGARIVVTAAGRDIIEEVHWGLTPNEQRLVWWDISWIWGPPEDHLAHLMRTIGGERLVYGTGWPLRLAETPRANISLLPDDLRSAPLGDPHARAI